MRKKLVSALVMVFFGFVILGVMEAGLRIVQWAPPSENMNMDNLNYNRYAHWPGGLGNLYPNQSGYWTPWKHRPYHVETNSLGLRNTEEPRPGAIRILVVGASLTFGVYVPNDDTWPAWLENQLRVRMKSKDGVQVFNGAIAGYTIEKRLKYIVGKGVHLKPDILIFPIFNSYLGNPKKPQDLETEPPEGYVRDKVKLSKRIKFYLRRRIAIYSAFSALKSEWKIEEAREELAAEREAEVAVQATAEEVETMEAAATPPAYLKQHARLRNVLELLSALTKEHGIQLVVSWGEIALRDDRSTANPMMLDLMTALSAELDFDLINLSDGIAQAGSPEALLFRQRNPETGALKGNKHLTRFGGYAVGRTVAEKIWNLGLLDIDARN